MKERKENAVLLTLVEETTATGNVRSGVERLPTMPTRYENCSAASENSLSRK
jgi:hypothetical protein